MQPLQNVLSISTAGKNRFLLHFNSLHSLTQWTAGIRLAMFEHASLQEAYTGSIIAGKGKMLNNIRTIMERCRFKQEDWARVRFGPGTPWRRCWCVVTPPDEKEYQKFQRSMKKRSAYDRAPRMVTGNIKFYDSKKTKKAQPIATITDVYAAYAIYPQSKPLIDQSTLVKIEGQITIHSQPQSTTEGFVFVMPEVHPAVSGLEMMLRFLFPVFDTFGLYGRPTRLIADTNNTKSIMFAFPKHKRYGYLDILDVANLIHTEGSQNWSEREWRKQLKEATARRMAANGSRTSSIAGSKTRHRSSLPSRNSTVRREDAAVRHVSFPASRPEFNQSADAIVHATPKAESVTSDAPASISHARTTSDTAGFAPARQQDESSSQLNGHRPGTNGSNDRSSYDSDRKQPEATHAEVIGQFGPSSPPAPVASPPAFVHSPGEVPQTRPQPSPELRRANSRISQATLAQMVDAGRMNGAAATTEWKDHEGREPDRPGQRDVIYDDDARPFGVSADANLAPQRTLANEAPKSQEHAPPVPAHRPDTINMDTTETHSRPPKRPGNLPPLNTAKAITRKPVPQRRPPEPRPEPEREPEPEHPEPEPEPDPDPPTPATQTSLGSLRHAVDEEALNRIITRRDTLSPDQDIRPDEESVYDDDDDSVASPDYASTHKSTDTKDSAASAPRPRMGVMKTVGAGPKEDDVVIGDAHYSRGAPSTPNPDIPTVDFGPTLSYMPTTRRPSTSDTLKKFGHERTDSDATAKGNDKRFSTGAKFSPGVVGSHDRPHSRSPSQDEVRRSLLWQPGMTAGPAAGHGPGLTPEQFVQQRATSNRVNSPVYLHRRTPSTPPPPRPPSGDWTAHARHQSYGRDLPPRPHSRGASSMLGHNDISSHLSAREQEHVARMTGSSFFNLSSSNSKQQAPLEPGGLVSAIDAREREKQEMKEGVSNQMVQHAIAQRQQQVQQQQQQAQAQQAQMYAARKHAYHQSMYELPAANRTWDTFNQMYQANGQGQRPRSGYFTPQHPQSAYPQNQYQYYQQHPGYYGGANGAQFPQNR
mgnify:CR=1 FL=1